MATRGPQVVRKSYINSADGTEKRSAFPEATTLRFYFLSPRKDAEDRPVIVGTRDIVLSTVSDDMKACALGHGLSQKLGDDLAGIASKAAKEETPVDIDPDDGWAPYAMERFDDALANIMAGVWVTEAEGGGTASSVTILLEAIVATFADAGKELSDEDMAKLRNALKDEDYRKNAKARKDVAAHMAAINAKRAEERRKKAAKALKEEAPTEDIDSLLG